MKDYLNIVYNKNNKIITNYPLEFTTYLCNKHSIVPGQKLLEIGCGRAEFLNGFISNGIDAYGIEPCVSCKEYDIHNRVSVEAIGVGETSFSSSSFDIIYSKSVIEHFQSPHDFMRESLRLLKPGGKLMVLTPDWETCWQTFYDDLTHYRPYTEISLKYLFEEYELKYIYIYKLTQLPCTWNSKFYRLLSNLCGTFHMCIPVRTKNKFLKWSKYKMLVAIGEK